MILVNRLFRNLRITLLVLAAVSLETSAQQTSPGRYFIPDDLFRVQTISATTWSPDGRYVAIEISNPARTLDRTIPTAEIRLLDVHTQSLRPLSSNSSAYLGFFNAVWSPNGQRLAFLSVDAEAIVRLWTWTVGAPAPVAIRDLDLRTGNNDPPFVWLGNDRLAVLAWDIGAEKRGSLYFRILRGRNIAEGWKRAVAGRQATVSVVESGGPSKKPEASARLITLDLRSGVRRTLARGGIHRLSVSADERTIAFLREDPNQPASSYFAGATEEDSYAAVNWGTERHVIDALSGAEVAPPALTTETRPSAPVAPAASAPRPDARRLSAAPAGDAALYLANASDGSHLLLAGGAGRPLSSSSEIWRANKWLSEVKLGDAQLITYTATDGAPLNAWLLLPPGYAAGTKVPVVTIIYPGLVYGSRTPSSFSPYQSDFEHPQLFAALGYAVLLPSMPPPKNPEDAHALAELPRGVLPAIDAAIARGFVDPDRVAVLGQSDGGFAVLGLITQTNRFRSAIASAGFSDLVSLYGTFYGQYRYGDAGIPETGQVFRMLQMEKGSGRMGGPPWAEAERYRENSAVLKANKVTTPLMLVHGDLDFVPIQQDEEFFTMLYRQDKRVTFVRYQGEWHTIASHANVLDLWERIDNWLKETMASRG
jgi:dipeptidyl aminopeptidase/acylaminoacyl peptidase